MLRGFLLRGLRSAERSFCLWQPPPPAQSPPHSSQIVFPRSLPSPRLVTVNEWQQLSRRTLSTTLPGLWQSERERERVRVCEGTEEELQTVVSTSAGSFISPASLPTPFSSISLFLFHFFFPRPPTHPVEPSPHPAPPFGKAQQRGAASS